MLVHRYFKLLLFQNVKTYFTLSLLVLHFAKDARVATNPAKTSIQYLQKLLMCAKIFTLWILREQRLRLLQYINAET